MREALQTFFRCVHNQPYSLFHERNFWQKFDIGAVPDYLLLAMLSLALRFNRSQFFENRSESMSKAFADMSWRAIVHFYFQERADAELFTVQAITLLAIYNFTGLLFPYYFKLYS